MTWTCMMSSAHARHFGERPLLRDLVSIDVGVLLAPDPLKFSGIVSHVLSPNTQVVKFASVDASHLPVLRAISSLCTGESLREVRFQRTCALENHQDCDLWTEALSALLCAQTDHLRVLVSNSMAATAFWDLAARHGLEEMNLVLTDPREAMRLLGGRAARGVSPSTNFPPLCQP